MRMSSHPSYASSPRTPLSSASRRSSRSDSSYRLPVVATHNLGVPVVLAPLSPLLPQGRCKSASRLPVVD